jgi:hypothetical protein
MALQYPKSNDDLTADPGIQLPKPNDPETVEYNMRVRLYNCAIFPKDIDEIIAEAKKRHADTGLKWNSRLSDYPSMLSAAAWIGVRAVAGNLIAAKNANAMQLQMLKAL